MYLPGQFDPKDPQVAIDIMQAHPFASLISTDDAGLPFVTHLPVHWEVHCVVDGSVLDGHDAKDALLKQLIADHEPAYADQWRGLSEDYTTKMLGAIVAFSLKIINIQCKVKVNQHRPEAHARMLEIYDAGGPDDQALGAWMRKMGLTGASH